jgi:hypothetical protein
MKVRVLLILLCLMAGGVWSLRGDESEQTKADKIREDLTVREQNLSRRFAEFEQSLLRLKQRLERSPKKEDQERAVILQKALDRAKDASMSIRFEQMVNFLKTKNLKSVGDANEAWKQSEKLAEDLRYILQLLREDTRAARLREEQERLKAMIKELESVIRQQKVVQVRTEIGKDEKTELVKIQNKVSERTADLAKKLGGQGGEAKNLKGEIKSAGKGKGPKGVGKNAGKDSRGDSKGKNAHAQTGEVKKEGGPGSQQKQAVAKGSGGKSAADAKGSKSGPEKQSVSKGNQGSQAKETSGKDAHGAGVKEKANGPARAKGEFPQKSQAKTGGQAGNPTAKRSKNSSQANSGSKSAGVNGKQGQAKGGESGSQSQAKNAGQQNQGGAQQQASSKGDGQKKSGANGNQQKNGQPPQIASSKKKIEDANYNQHQAEKNIEKGKNRDATDDQGEAIQKLEEAKKKLEDLLRQMREEELERLLAALQARCEKMLAMQMQALAGTEQVQASIQSHKDKKATRFDKSESLKLSDNEKEIVDEATKAVEMLEAEGSAVAFPEVFKQVREDMKHVQRRLGIVDTGAVTQAIEKDIIDTLKEMIEALKKARQELDNKKNPPSNQPPPNVDPKLLDLLAELKMIRSMQKRVNDRTRIYGRQYQGEQASQPTIVRELHNLADRQERIFDVTNRIAKGDNR